MVNLSSFSGYWRKVPHPAVAHIARVNIRIVKICKFRATKYSIFRLFWANQKVLHKKALMADLLP